MKFLLENWRLYLNEITVIPNNLKQRLKNAIIDSKFWTHPHTEDEVDLGHWGDPGTPATEVLSRALDEAAKDLGSNLRFTISVDENYPLGPGDQYEAYPNHWKTKAAYLGPLKARPYHLIKMWLRPLTEDYNMDDLDPNELAAELSRSLNHEIVHYEQLKKQAQSKGISNEEAYQELLADPKQFSDSGDRSKYLTRHIEVDAYAHEAAEQLLDVYSAEEALELIKTRDPKLGGVVRDYLNVLGDNPTELKKFWLKLYSQIMSQK